MKKNDWITRKIYSTSGILIKMEHSYNFQDYYNGHSPKNKSTYVYVNGKSPQYILPEEKSLYRSDLQFPLPWKEKIKGMGEDTEEEKKFTEEWFNYVKSKQIGSGLQNKKKIMPIRSRQIVVIDESNIDVHDDAMYEEWVKRKTLIKKSVEFKLLSKDKWNIEAAKHEHSVNLNSANEFVPGNFATSSTYLDELPYNPELFSNLFAIPDKKFPKPNPVLLSDKVPDKDCDLNVPYDISKDFIESPPDYAKAEEEMDSSDCLVERQRIFKNPTIAKVKNFRSDMEAVLTAKWENKVVDIVFFNWVFTTSKGVKLTIRDNLRNYLKIGQVVNFHGARSIPDTDKYETFLVYDGTYPSLSQRSGYDLKKWVVEKELYLFPRRGTVKSLMLPNHAVIDVENPARNVTRKVMSIAMENCFVNKNDASHPGGWIDEFVKPGDKIQLELTLSKDGSVSIKRAWKFPEEKILNPKPIKAPNSNVPRDKFTFSCKEGKKSCTGIVTEITEKGTFTASFKDQKFQINFNQIYIDGHEASLGDVEIGTEVSFRHFRKPPHCDQFWTPLVWKGPQPNLNDMMRKYELGNDREAVVDSNPIYVGIIEEFLLPSHAVIKTKCNNGTVIYASVSKAEILPVAADKIWIDKIITKTDILTFRLIKVMDLHRYRATHVCV